MGQKELSHDISDIFGIPYLSNVDDPDSRVVDHHSGKKPSIAAYASCEVAESVKWVHFLWDIGFPKTYISHQVCSPKAEYPVRRFNANLI